MVTLFLEIHDNLQGLEKEVRHSGTSGENDKMNPRLFELFEVVERISASMSNLLER